MASNTSRRCRISVTGGARRRREALFSQGRAPTKEEREEALKDITKYPGCEKYDEHSLANWCLRKEHELGLRKTKNGIQTREYIRRRLTQTPNPTVFDILCWAREGDISNATASQLVFQMISEELRESVDRKYGLGPDQNLKTEGKKGAECDSTLTLTNTRTPSQNLEYRDVGMVMGAWETAIEGSKPAVPPGGPANSAFYEPFPQVQAQVSVPGPSYTSVPNALHDQDVWCGTTPYAFQPFQDTMSAPTANGFPGPIVDPLLQPFDPMFAEGDFNVTCVPFHTHSAMLNAIPDAMGAFANPSSSFPDLCSSNFDFRSHFGPTHGFANHQNTSSFAEALPSGSMGDISLLRDHSSPQELPIFSRGLEQPVPSRSPFTGLVDHNPPSNVSALAPLQHANVMLRKGPAPVDTSYAPLYAPIYIDMP